MRRRSSTLQTSGTTSRCPERTLSVSREDGDSASYSSEGQRAYHLEAVGALLASGPADFPKATGAYISLAEYHSRAQLVHAGSVAV
jgi:hypothetical protein